MARRKSTKMSRMRNIEPAPLTFTVPLTGGAFQVPTTDFLDLSQMASLLSRRFYRQGLNWAVAGIKVLTVSSPGGGSFLGTLTVSKLPNTWVMANSWKKSMSVWSKMNNEALADTESLRPRFLDFKIFANSEHHAAGFAGNLLPVSASLAPAIVGEWESSKIFIPNATNVAAATTQDLEIIATGNSFPGVGASGLNAVSAIEGYAASRILPNVLDPNTPGDADDTSGITPENWMSAIFNEGNVQMTDVIEELTTENNIAPYPFENDGVNLDTMYPGGGNQLSGLEIHSLAVVSGSTIGGTTRIKGGNFPCGLISITHTNIAEGGPYNLLLEIDLIPGSHRGYLAEPMQEM